MKVCIGLTDDLNSNIMKNIVFACDGKNFSNGAFAFAKLINETEPVLLIGAFFLSIDYRLLIPSSIYPDPGPLADLVADERVNAIHSVQLFKEECLSNGIEYRIHEDGKSWDIDELIKESRFSDLVVISEELFFRNWGNKQPNHFLREVMHGCECPVIVIPENFNSVEKILIAYDGKPSSVFALKMFSLLFPTYSNLETNILYIKDEENENIPEVKQLQEYILTHFLNAKIKKLHSDRKSISNWISNNKNALLVTGAFSRSGLSTLLKDSFVAEVIKNHSIPVFIAHNRQ